MGSKDKAQAVRPGREHLYLLSHPTGPFFSKILSPDWELRDEVTQKAEEHMPMNIRTEFPICWRST